MTDLAQRVHDELLQAIEKDQLVLPTLPEVALRVREAAEAHDRTVIGEGRFFSLSDFKNLRKFGKSTPKSSFLTIFVGKT